MPFIKEQIGSENWVIYEAGHNWKTPIPTVTFAFDTETLTYVDNQILSNNEILNVLNGLNENEIRSKVECKVWAWQCYDEFNGFFMTNDFYLWLDYQCQCKYKFGWCYNSTFDFAQIDYKLLGEKLQDWKVHERKRKDDKAYMKNQSWSYSSLHSNGARYSYKLWIPYRSNVNRHKSVHSVDYRDFMKLVTGGLKKLLEDLDVCDNFGNQIRKLEMEYQAVDSNNLTEQEISYCCNDVKGLYFAIKKFNETIEEQSNNECHIFGKSTNLMTAGGFAKRELLRSMYPDINNNKSRLKKYQSQHPISVEQDEYFRRHHLYRGGISFVNPKYQGKLLTKKMMGSPMYRYDVNSEYPFAMSIMRDLIGKPKQLSYSEWLSWTKEQQEEYECILCITNITGKVKAGMCGIWYDVFAREYVEEIDEDDMHLMFERELQEMSYWYDLEYSCETVIIVKRGDYSYKSFVDENYKLKAEAKKMKNKTVQQSTKLKLNASYGKLSERIERTKGHYELNEETGAIHYVEDERVVDTSAQMSILVGALCTAIARCYILSKIREICHTKEHNMNDVFVYIDTDSIHAFASYDKADAFSLGGLKLEATCDAVKYLLPKTYIDIERYNKNQTIPYHFVKNVKRYELEAHSKGINIASINLEFQKTKRFSLKHIDSMFEYGQKYIVLIAMNVKGGKVLLPTYKYLAREELRPNTIKFNNYYSER